MGISYFLVLHFLVLHAGELSALSIQSRPDPEKYSELIRLTRRECRIELHERDSLETTIADLAWR
jgi:hypothetical protein